MMSNLQTLLSLAPALVAGLVFGGIFFGGLWWTVRRGLNSSRPALWFGLSLLVRLGIVLSGFYLVAGGSVMRLLACVLGFTAARWVGGRLIVDG